MNMIIMNMFIQFINRENELLFLEEQIIDGNSFIVIYGRRRVGKSELLKQFIKNKKYIYLHATQEVEKEIVESFSKEIAQYFNDHTLEINPFSRFKQIFDYLDKIKGKLKDLIIVIDEFPYLIDANSAIPSILQKYWDINYKNIGLNLILCGSSISSMETDVLGRKSPLYGRRTGQWKVDPLKFKDFINFFPKSKFVNLVEFYSITGGIPLYILTFNDSLNTYDNVVKSIAMRGSLLYEEAEFILKEELREPRIYFSILHELSKGVTTMNTLSNALGMERTSLTRYLKTLENLDLIDLNKPFGAKIKSRKTHYVLKDNYFKFWFQFIYPFKKDLDSFDFSRFQENFEKKFSMFMGFQFELICREALALIEVIPMHAILQWWETIRDYKTDERKVIELDLITHNKQNNELIIAECKWQNNVNSINIVRKLQYKIQFLKNQFPVQGIKIYIFAKSYKYKLNDEKVIQLDLKDVEKVFQ
jgi:uncharacterized protein